MSAGPFATPFATRVRQWNSFARALVSQYGVDPVDASRVYLLLSVAQALAVGERSDRELRDAEVGELIDLSSVVALRERFPHDPHVQHEVTRLRSRLESSADALRPVQAFLTSRRADGSARRLTVPRSADPWVWRTLENRPPVRPAWGEVAPFGLSKALPHAPLPVPAGSEAHRQELAAVVVAASDPDQDELDAITFWSCEIGGETPTGRWLRILERALNGVDNASLLHMLALAAAAMFNAGIACWADKYRHVYPRPSNVDPAVPTRIHVPNFPSYTSGHSSFSWALVASVGPRLPEEAGRLAAEAERASWSRVTAGVHYPMDCTGGRMVGEIVGDWTVGALPDLRHLCEAAQAEAAAQPHRAPTFKGAQGGAGDSGFTDTEGWR